MRTQRHVLAIDAGTTGVRAMIFDESQAVAAAAYRELEMRYPRPGWVEQDADFVWRTARTVVAEALRRARLEPTDLAVVGLASQRSSMVAWDGGSLSPLSPLIVWQDGRGAERCRELGERGFFVAPSMAVSKADWILRNLPAAKDAAAAGRLRLGGADAWLCAKLTGGAHVTDHSNASATGFYSYMDGGWDAALLDALSIDPGSMPELVDSSGVAADTDAGEIGAAIPIGGICGDQQASLVGLGCTHLGQTKCSYGTAAMVNANSAESVAVGGPGTYPLVAWRAGGTSTYCIEGSVHTAGAAVQWLRDGLGLVGDASETSALAQSVDDSGGVWAVPAFQGLATPVMEPEARAVIGGLSRGSSRAHVVRAVLEGIANRVADAAEAVWQGTQAADALRVDGRASRNDFLMQTQADTLGVTVERSAESDGAAVGAAALAASALQIWGDGPPSGRWDPDRVFEPVLSGDERERRRELWKRRLDLAARDLP